MKFGAGQPVRRLEDDRLIQGQGQFTDDLTLPGMLHAAVLRSPHAHARIASLDVSAARDAAGVKLVLTATDLDKAGLGPIPCVATMPNRDGTPMYLTDRPALARDRVRHLGDPVAFVVAETQSLARDALDLIRVDYDELPVVADTDDAVQADPLWADAKSNVALDFALGDKAAVDKAFASAHHVTQIRLNNQRLVVNAMEPRAAIGDYDPAHGKLTLYTGSQGAHGMRGNLARHVFKLPEEKVRVVTKDVGGGFGMKSFLYPEYPLVMLAAKLLERPVKWTGDRTESFLTDTQGRDNVTESEIALSREGKILAIRTRTVANLGAYLSQYAPFIPTQAAPGMQVGVYAIPAFYTEVKCVLTNTVPVDAYRGAGRPEAAYVIERLVDMAAREMRIEPDELRRRNFIAPAQMPYTFPNGLVLDSGEFARNMTDAMALSDWQGFAVRRAASKTKGKLLGRGLAYYVEKTAGGFELTHLEVRPDGTVHVIAGTQSNGQGHETAYAQLVAGQLGIDITRVKVTNGDTDALRAGGGTGGSRSLTVAGAAIGIAVKTVLDKGKEWAADELEAAVGDIEYADGAFRISGTDRALDLFAVAALALRKSNSGLAADGEVRHKPNTWPNGCHVCEVEIDPETGVSRITRYAVVDDFGKLVNPLLVAGQVHGGVVQGLGQAMGEHAQYDMETGQLLTGSFMDYWMPRADNMPEIHFRTNEIPCTTNPLGVKGCGEAGTVGAAPAFVNAVVDALNPYGIAHIDMPVTPLKVWSITRGRMA